MWISVTSGRLFFYFTFQRFFRRFIIFHRFPFFLQLFESRSWKGAKKTLAKELVWQKFVPVRKSVFSRSINHNWTIFCWVLLSFCCSSFVQKKVWKVKAYFERKAQLQFVLMRKTIVLQFSNGIIIKVELFCGMRAEKFCQTNAVSIWN